MQQQQQAMLLSYAGTWEASPSLYHPAYPQLLSYGPNASFLGSPRSQSSSVFHLAIFSACLLRPNTFPLRQQRQQQLLQLAIQTQVQRGS